MRQKLKRLLKIVNLVVRFLMIVSVMFLPLVQFVYAYSFSEQNGELAEYDLIASYLSMVLITTSPCLYGFALYMHKDLQEYLPQKRFFVVCGSAFRCVLKTLFWLACLVMVFVIVAMGVEHLI